MRLLILLLLIGCEPYTNEDFDILEKAIERYERRHDEQHEDLDQMLSALVKIQKELYENPQLLYNYKKHKGELHENE